MWISPKKKVRYPLEKTNRLWYKYYRTLKGVRLVLRQFFVTKK